VEHSMNLRVNWGIGITETWLETCPWCGAVVKEVVAGPRLVAGEEMWNLLSIIYQCKSEVCLRIECGSGFDKTVMCCERSRANDCLVAVP
jgi:hypothetical protein